MVIKNEMQFRISHKRMVSDFYFYFKITWCKLALRNAIYQKDNRFSITTSILATSILNPASNYIFKANNKNTITSYEICSN